MIKRLTFLKKKASLTQDEFLRYWKEKHGPLVAKIIPGVRKYIQCHPVRVPGIESEIDGIAELWWDNVKSFPNILTWRQSNEGRVLIEDEDKFLDKSKMIRFLAEEKVILEG